jgi:hypothetical protein
VLNAACSAKFPHVLPDSRALVVQLESTLVARDSLLVSFDVESMYPSIDVSLAVDACVHATPSTQRLAVRTLLDWVMRGNFFQFEDAVYHQIQGGAMGTPCMPPVANIHMAHWVEAPVRASAAYWPQIYRRFIDDGFLVWEQDRASLLVFLHALNTALPTINLTWQISDTSMAYMDLVITKDLSMSDAPMIPLVISTHQKAHNLYLYIPAVSFHRPHVFAGFVKGELLRYAITNTAVEGFERMKGLFKQRLLDRGYPEAWLCAVFESVRHSDRYQHLHGAARSRRAAAQSLAPVFVAHHGHLESTHSLSAVVNAVYARHMQQQQVRVAMCDAPRVTVAYRVPPSLSQRLVRARL